LVGDASRFDFPRPMIGREDADFSLSGLKTAVRLEILKIGSLSDADVNDLAASFQAAMVDVIVDRVRAALKLFTKQEGPCNSLVIGGGVGANGAIRRALEQLCAESGLRFVSPPPNLCADNGAMIAWAGLERLKRGLVDDMSFVARPRWPLDQRPGEAHHGKA
ncbi:MAG: tRNA (adenosine(37)-N6)-threonylcarbamoyltransferase complex transferase subunit TsaD, partial [Methylocystis sp.]|nr:tRNA (adenosine(37)-N6)-threonylcarbamoyltransferase complex transferase subunit TsaD [Methylocystis sp.]